MRTKEEFLKRWQAHVAGLMALGSSKVKKIMMNPLSSTTEFGAHLLDLEEQSRTLLEKLWDDLQPKDTRKSALPSPPSSSLSP